MRSIVDAHLRRLDLKRPGLRNHALRTARYARVVDKALNNPRAAVPNGF